MKRIALVSLLILSSATFAQNKGEEKTLVSALVEEVLPLFQKQKLFNLSFLMRSAFESTHKQEQGTPSSSNSDFRFSSARLVLGGNYDERLSYSLCFHLNRSTNPLLVDGTSSAIDWAHIAYDITPKWNLKVGKMLVNIGSYELDSNPIYEYSYTDFGSLVYPAFAVGTQLSYKASPGHMLIVQGFNVSSESFAERLNSNNFSQGNFKASELPIGGLLAWKGSFFNGKLSTIYSYSAMQYVANGLSHTWAFGHQYKGKSQTLYLDLGYSYQEVDYAGIVSKDISRSLVKRYNVKYNQLFKNAVYKVIILHYNQFITPKYDFVVKGSYETAGAKNNLFSENFRENFTYTAALQYKPLAREDLRFYLAYIGKTTKYDSSVALPKYNESTLSLGFYYTIPVLKSN